MMRLTLKLSVLCFLISCAEEPKIVVPPAPTPQPPFWGTIFLDPDILTSEDSSAFISVNPTGMGERTIYDRRVENWITIEALLYEAIYADGLTIEIQFNPEFSESEANIEAPKYADAVGLLSTSLRKDVDALWINKGKELFGGGNRSILIHTGQTLEYERDGILEETLVHEATHTSLDNPYAQDPDWKEAQLADGNFISSYARDYPDREDLAETYLLYIAVRYRKDRISTELEEIILATIPHRMSYLDTLPLDMYPIVY